MAQFALRCPSAIVLVGYVSVYKCMNRSVAAAIVSGTFCAIVKPVVVIV